MKDEKLVRCRPCGYVMKESELGAVCPACGLPCSVFEPYREKVSEGRLRFLALDTHPIAIHLSQTFVAVVPGLIIFNFLFPNFYPEIIHPVITFSVYVFPLTLILSGITGYMDGLTRFKTIKTPLLKKKIIYTVVIMVLSIVQLVIFTPNHYTWYFVLLSFATLACAIKLGLMGKHLIDVILPGTLTLRKKKTNAAPVKKMGAEEIERLKAQKQAREAAKAVSAGVETAPVQQEN